MQAIGGCRVALRGRIGLDLSRRRLLGHQLEELRAGHLAQHAGRHRVGPVVIVDVNVQPVHHIEVRVGKQLFHRGIADLGTNAALHEWLEVRLGREALHVFERGQGSRLAARVAVAFGLAMAKGRFFTKRAHISLRGS